MSARSMTCAVLLGAGLATGLTGCGSKNSDLEAYVAEVKAKPSARVEPLPTVAVYEPFIYQPGGRRAPFTPFRRQTGTSAGGNASNGVLPDTNRPTEALERFPLDSLHMLGTITSAGTTYALIAAPDGVLHRVKRGEHLGQNYGQVESVSDKGITITEIVPDGADGYTKRGAALAPSG